MANPTVLIESPQIYGGLTSDVARLQTRDGMTALDLWLNVIQPSIEDYNAIENGLANLLAFKVDPNLTKEEVVQTVGTKWDRGGREISKPTGVRFLRRFWVRTAMQKFTKYMGYTRKYLTENGSEHIAAMLNADLKALQDQKYQEMLAALYTAGGRVIADEDTGEAGLVSASLVDGTGNWPIPPNGTNRFDNTHNHYSFVDTTTTAWSVLDNRQALIRNLAKNVTEHGYRRRLMLLCNAADTGYISACTGFSSIKTTSEFGVVSVEDALRGLDTQATIKTFTDQFAGLFRGVGTIENMTVMECDFLPIGYFVVFSYQGPNSPDNPLSWKDYPVTSFSDNPFPFYETIMETSFGAAVRKRLNGAILYFAAGATAYATPSFTSLEDATGDWNGQ